ncbi:peptide chain release factor N(5)-glutamine methyltransferase [Paenibacillus mendelii]|uniref:Release factor glutamine methyltransferase n=1 Tax=Paenibacillus mendelii TaxID=206163 RepID=A0ABV6J4S0_9BACL|nr:peptide chain release factor N(5)-glutamine methyltransferase [Paenibacillus mendelii]MCQ6561943.1 peptide chain release factor N(5)-glutamine methyltransferase [Paenibacillus mendelii]
MERRLDGNEAGSQSGQASVTLREACMQASLFLQENGIGEPRANAELLLMHMLGIERAALLRDWQEPFPEQRRAEWDELVQRKAAGEPVQYIIGEQWFYGLPFTVTPAVLIPRPETELLIEAVLEAADQLWPDAARSTAEAGGDAAASAAGSDAGAPAASWSGAGPTVLDVGTGSGAIGVTLAAQRPQWRVCASDLSPDALAVARTNAECHGAAPRMAFVQGDLLVPFIRRHEAGTDASGDDEPAAGLRIDVLVSNPPYIPAGDIAGLQPEVRDHEPRLALDGGADGLAPYRSIIAQLPLLAAMPRIVAFELGLGQAEAVADLLRQCGPWREIRTIRDYAGIDRHVMAIEPIQ